MDKRYRIIDGLTASDVACMPFVEIWTRLMQMGKDRDALRAEAARLREALVKAEPYISHGGDEHKDCPLCAVRAAITTPDPGWLERKMADAASEEREELDRIDASVHRCCPTAHGVHDALDRIPVLLARAEKTEAELAATREERDGLAGMVAKLSKICPDCKGSGYITTYADDGFPEGNPCERCDTDPAAILADRDARIRAEARKEALEEVQRECRLGLDGYCVYLIIQSKLEALAQEADRA